MPPPPGPDLGRRDRLRQVLHLIQGRGTPPTTLFPRLVAAFGDLVHIRFGTEQVYLASHPDMVRQVLVTDGRITHKGRGLEVARLLLGNGLLTAEGEEHMRNRRLVAPAFHHEHIAGYASVMASAARDADHHWSELTGAVDGGPVVVDMAGEMAALTLRIAGLTLFGTDLTDRSTQVGDSLSAALEAFGRFQVPGATWLLRVPSPWSRRMNTARDSLHAVVDELIDQHRAEPDRFAGDVLSLLLRSRDSDGGALSHQQIRDEVLTLLLAGHETTANLLTWAWFLLDGHPEAAVALHAEVDALPGPPDATEGFSPALPVTRAVLAEALRLYPPAWTVSRRYQQPARLGGYDLPAGALAVTSQWVLHRDPRWWGAQAADFRPERWLAEEAGEPGSGCPHFDERAPGHPRYAFFPFGGGRRLCLGEDFAWTEAVLVLATLARSWAPRRVPEQVVDVQPLVTLRPRFGMRMALRPRLDRAVTR